MSDPAALYSIIGGDGKEYGPVPSDQIGQWIQEGRANGQTRAKREGQDWQPMAEFPEFASLLASRYIIPPSLSSTAPPDATDVAESLLARSGTVEIGRCLARGWELMGANIGLLFGAAFLVVLTELVMAYVPFIGNVATFILRGALYGGLYLVFLNRVRGQPATVADTFSGFGGSFAQLMLTGMLTSLLITIGSLFCLLPGLFLTVIWVFSVPLAADRRLDFWNAMELSRKLALRNFIPLALLMFIVFLPVVLFDIYATGRLVAEMWPALTDGNQNLASMLATMRPHLEDWARLAVQLALGRAFIRWLTIPFAFAVLMYAYDDLFGSRDERQA